jgi:hypothetical protein
MMKKNITMLSTLFCAVLMIFVSCRNLDEQHGSAQETGLFKLNLYEYCDIKTSPMMNTIRELADGNLHTYARFQGGPEIAGNIEFIFPEKIEIAKIRFMQSKTIGAREYLIKGDSNGDGLYDVKIIHAKNKNIIGEKWIEHKIGKKLKGIKFEAVSGNSGYRSVYPFLSEFEIYSPNRIKKKKRKETVAHLLTLGKQLPVPQKYLETKDKKRLDLIVCSDLFMAGIAWNGKGRVGNFSEYKPFKNFAQKIKELGATSVRLFPEVSCCRDKMFWKSKYCNDIGKDLLSPFVKALHKEGIKVYAFLHSWITPLQERSDKKFNRYAYPNEQSDRNPNPKLTYKYPCIISDNDFRDKWLGILKEFAAAGMDGVYINPDEYYYRGHSLSRTRCPNCQRNFKEMFGYDSLPKSPGNNEKYRKWKLYEYTQLARLFEYWRKELKKQNPELKLINLAHNAFYLRYNQRLYNGICFDIMGKNVKCEKTGSSTDNIGFWQTGWASATTKRYSAAAGGEKYTTAGHTLYGTSKETSEFFPLKFMAPFTASIMNGVDTVSVYRYSYIYRNGWGNIVRRAFHIADALNKWGIFQSHTPSETCMLFSRAGEDWWQVKINALLEEKDLGIQKSIIADRPDLIENFKRGTAKRELQIERFRGMASNKCIESLLLEKGLPYDFKFIDQPMKDLSKYKLLIIPFGYAISEKAFASIKKAVAAGTKLIIFDMLGEVNEYGIKYRKPLLSQLLGNKNVLYINEALSLNGMMKSSKEKYWKTILKMLGNNPYYFNPNGALVEYIPRELSPKSKILMLANWERKKKVNVILGLDMPKGKYKLEICDQTYSFFQGKIDGKNIVSEKELHIFSLDMPPGSLMILRIQPEE